MPTLDWIGKKAVVNHHREVPYRILKEDSDLSYGKKDSGNLIVEGDNLEALKALLPYYKGKVKCIYIDPPYNTGNEGWVYNDNVNSPEIKKWLGKVVGKEMEDLSRHDKWLCMMYPRLQLLREFLSEDGIIFISIDEVEFSHLKLILDEIFGASNFIESIIWNKRIPKNDAGIGNIHEYVVAYRKSSSYKYELTALKDGIHEVYDYISDLKNSNIEINEAEKLLTKYYRQKKFDRGITLYNNLNDKYEAWGKINMSWPNADTFGPRYEILHPKTQKPVKIPERGWRWTKERFLSEMSGEMLERYDGSIVAGKIWFAKDENTQPSSIKFLKDVDRMLLRSIISLKSDGGLELENLLGEKSRFSYPKPSSLLKLLIDSISDKNSIILDSFAGSGTTAHAVMELNKEDGGNRKFVCVEMLPEIAENITSKRAQKVIDKLDIKETDGFKFVKLGEQMFTADGDINPEISYEDLARHVYFMATGTPLDSGITKFKTPLIGISNGAAIYLLYNGILKDTSVNGGNRLTQKVLKTLPKYDGVKIIYGTACGLSESVLRKNNIVFRQTPYTIFDR